MNRSLMIRLLFILVFLGSAVQAASTVEGKARVRDGDTIVVGEGAGKVQRC